MEAADRQGVYVMLNVWGHDDLRPDCSSWGNGRWRRQNNLAKLEDQKYTSPWSEVRKNGMSVTDFVCAGGSDPAWLHQLNYYRYLIARYSGYRSLGMWSVVAEIDGIQDGTFMGDPTNEYTPVREIPIPRNHATKWVDEVRSYFTRHDPSNFRLDARPVSAGTCGFRRDFYLAGQFVDDHCWDWGDFTQIEGGGFLEAATNSVRILNARPDAKFRVEMIRIASHLLGKVGAAKPLIHAEAGVTERSYGRRILAGDYDLESKGILAYHYFLMTDLFRGAAGTPLKWCDSKEFGEMKACGTSPHFSGTRYRTNYFKQIEGNKELAHLLMVWGLAPWQINGRWCLDPTKVDDEDEKKRLEALGYMALGVRSPGAAAVWIVSKADPPDLSSAQGGVPTEKTIDLRDAVAEEDRGEGVFDLFWFDPWSGSFIKWHEANWCLLEGMNFWDDKMERVTPTGFGARQKEDVVVFILKQD
jgi:hypothetical protein